MNMGRKLFAKVMEYVPKKTSFILPSAVALTHGH